MFYDKEILRVLKEAGDNGLKTSKIARHVFNACNSFFNDVSYKEIHSYVSQYLIRNSRNPGSIIERTDIRGVYRLNMNSGQTQQLLLEFTDAKQPETPKAVDKSLSLW